MKIEVKRLSDAEIENIFEKAEGNWFDKLADWGREIIALADEARGLEVEES